MHDDYFWRVQYPVDGVFTTPDPVALFIAKSDAELFADALTKQEGLEFEVVPV